MTTPAARRRPPAPPGAPAPPRAPEHESPVPGSTSRPWKELLLVGAVTCASTEAALVHAWYVPQSFLEWWGYGVFFLGCAVGQALYGPVLLLRRSLLVVQAGIWANAGVVALYVFTRVWGVPWGPHAEAVEAVGLFDLASVVAELIVVVALCTMLTGRDRRFTCNGLLVLGVSMWLLRAAVGGQMI